MQLAPDTNPNNEKPPVKLAPDMASKFSYLPPPSQENVKTDSYDVGYVQAYGDRQEYRAEVQTGWQMWRNSATQALTGVITDVGKVAGFTLDLDAWGDLITGGERDFSNFFTEAMDSVQESVRENVPVNQTREATTEFAPGDSTWWAGNMPSIFSALSFMIPTRAAMGAASVLGKSLGAGSKFLTSKAGQTIAKGIVGATFSRYNESMFEAGEQAKLAYKTAIDQGMSEEEARLAASKAGSDTWNANMLAIGPDLFQYTQLAGGFKTFGKAANLIAGAGLEGLEEAYQSAVGKEAQGAAFDKHDFFGSGFDHRLNEYIQDADLQTAAFFGALGGGVFSGTQEIVDNVYRPKNERLITEALAKKRAEAIGDIETIKKLKDATFARLAFDHLSTGRVGDLKNDLDLLSSETDIDPEVRKQIEQHKKDLEYLETQYDKTVGNRNIPKELVMPLLATQLDYRQSSRTLGELKEKSSKAVQDVVATGEVNPTLSRAKELWHTMQAYEQLAKRSGKNMDKQWQDYNQQFTFMMNDFHQGTTAPFFSQIVSSRDNEIQDLFNKLVAQQERTNIIREDLNTLSSPTGVADFANLQKERAAEQAALITLRKADSTVEQLEAAKNAVKDPAVKKSLQDRINQLQEAKKETNQAKTKEVVDKTKKKEKSKEVKEEKQVTKQDDIPPIDTDVPIEIPKEDLDLVFGPPVDASDIVQDVEQVNVPDDAKADKIAIENGELVVKRLEEEKPAPEQPTTELNVQKKEEQEAPGKSIEENGAKTVLKEIAGEWKKNELGFDYFEIEQNPDTTPKRQDYYYAEDYKTKNNPIPVDRVFDSKDGVLTVNTPNVIPGQEVIIKIEPNWPFWKTNDPESVVMNVYAVDNNGKAKGKPLTQIPSSKNPKTSTPASIALRKAINDSGKTSVRTRIVYKNYGDFLALRNPDGSRLRNNISVLETDMMVNSKGDWVVGKTPHNPIFAYVDASGIIQTPSVINMKGIDYIPSNLDRINDMDRVVRNPANNLEGGIGVLRINPLGGYTFALVEPRTVNEEEILWLRENLASYLRDKRYEDLKNVIHIINAGLDENISAYKDSNRLVNIAGDIAFRVKHESFDYWIKINSTGKFAENFEDFMTNKPFNFQVIDKEGIKREGTQNSDRIEPEVKDYIYTAFDDLLTSQFKNVDKNFINTEGTYVDVTGKSYKNYYQYLRETNSVTTDLPEGYSFFNATIYLDTNIDEKPIVQDTTKDVIQKEKPAKTQKVVPQKPSITEAKGPYKAFQVSEREWTVVSADNQVVASFKAGPELNADQWTKTARAHQLKLIKDLKKTAEKAAAARNKKPKKKEDKSLFDAMGGVEHFQKSDEQISREYEEHQKKQKKKIDWDKLADEGLDERFRLASLAQFPFKVMGQKELDWMQATFGPEYLTIAEGVDKVLSIGGLEAFGYYHNAMIRLAQLAEEGTGYHEAFHFVMLTQLSATQQANLIKAAEKVYGKKDRLQLEEALAEDFRRYMLSDGTIVPQVESSKGLFRRILDYIAKALGFKSSIEKMFEKTANFSLTPEAIQNIGLARDYNMLQDIDDLRHRLVPGFTRINQQIEAISASTHRLLEIAIEAAGEDASFDEVLENPANVSKFIDRIKEEYSAALHVATIQMGQIEDGELEISEDQMRELAAKQKLLKVILDNWENKTEGENTVEGYQTTLVKNLSNYGFSVKVKEIEVTEEDDTDAAENTEADEVLSDDPNAKERIHGVSFFLNNPLKTLSGKIKRFLATIPEYERTEDGQVKRKADGSPMVATTIFGTPKFIEFNRVYANLSSKLAGHKNIYSRLTELAVNDPIIAAVKDKLDIHIAKGQQSIDPLPAQFFTTFNKSKYRFFTTRVGFKDGNPIAEVMETDRRNIERTLIEDWRSNAVKKSFIDTDGKVNKGKAERLLKLVTSNRRELTYEESKMLLQDILKEVGIELPPQVWQKLDKDKTRKQIGQQMMFGLKAPSAEAFLSRAVEGNDPFEETGLITELANRAKDYVDDLQAKTFINEKGNQVSAINLNTYITDLISKLTDTTSGADQIRTYERDNFYKNNAFLTHLKDKEKARQVTVNIFSAYRESFTSDPKEYADTTSQDSFISRLVAYHSNGNPSGYFYLGTLSDKPQQLSILLPKRKGENAKAFLKDVLRNTVNQEIARIQRLKANLKGVDNNEAFSPNDVSGYKNGAKFFYIPALNNIPNLADSLTSGELDPSLLATFEPQINKAIDDFIANEEKAYFDKLIELDLIARTKSGENYVNKNLPEALASGVGNRLREFFYNDLAWRLDMSKVLHGDLAFYKNAETYFKRGYQVITPGLQGYINPELKSAGKKKTHKRAIVASSIKRNNADYLHSLATLIDPTVTKDRLVKDLAKGSSDNRAISIAIQYATSNKTDAQGWVTIHAYKDILLSVGQWTNDHDFLYERAWKQGKSVYQAIQFSNLSDEEKKYWLRREGELLLQPLKPFTFGDRPIRLSDGSTMMLKEQYKESLAPLLPEWANRHTEYRELLAAMERNNADIVSDSEAVKVGAYSINTDLSKPLITRDVPTESMRFPFFVPEKVKEEILAGTQLEKLIVGNILPETKYTLPNGKPLSGKEIIREYHSIWSDIIKQDYEDFTSMFTMDANLRVNDSQKLQFLKDLKLVLLDELANRDLPDNYVNALTIIKNKLDQPDFMVGLDFPALGKKYEQILTNLFKKHLLKQKLPGDSLINLADFGTPRTEQSSELKFITNDNGKLVEAEVGLPQRFVKGLGLKRDVNYNAVTGKVNWESLNDDQKSAMQLIIYRIPTQGKNSMMPVRIAFVLPDSTGSVIMVPGEGTKQGGFDFDVDKSYIMKRTTVKGKVENTNENKLFDIHWSILTNLAHAEELLNPLDSKVHDEVIDDYIKKGIVTREQKTSPFSVTTDLEMEKLAKYSKAMIGVFSKFAVAHSTYGSIADLVTIKTPIAITNTEGYKYDEVGRIRDDSGNMISDNHSAQQNSALDAQKDPKLGYLNITTFNANVLAYMTELGVNQKLALGFLNQPILRQLSDEYFKNGDNNMENALASVLTKHTGLAGQLETMEKKRLEILSPSNLDQSLTLPIEENQRHQAQVLSDFKRYFYAAQDMAKLNTAMSTDTVRDMTSIAAIQSYVDVVNYSTENRTSVKVDPDVFQLSKSPVKRIAAFYQYGVRAALQFTKQFYPYHSAGFEQVRTMIAEDNLHRNGKLRDKETIEEVNQAMTLYMLGEDKQLEKILSKYSPRPGSRWDYFAASDSIEVYVNGLKDKYPRLQKNLFLQALRGDSQERKVRNSVQMIGVNNTHGNFNKTNLTNAWWDLMTDASPEVRTLAYDLARFAIQTSGFKITPFGFVDLIPAEFWRESGLAAYHQALVTSYVDGAKTVEPIEASKIIIRHLFSHTNIVKSVPFKNNEENNFETTVANVKVAEKGSTHVLEFTGTNTSSVFDPLSELKYARYARMFDRQARRWRLYERQGESKVYREIQPLGEYNKFVQYTSNANEVSVHPAHEDLRPAYSLHFENVPELPATDAAQKIGIPLGSRTTTIATALGLIKQRTTNTVTLKVIEALERNIDKVANVHIQLAGPNELGLFGMGAFHPLLNVIYLNQYLGGQEEVDRIVLHEILHAYSVRILRNPKTDAEVNFKQNLQRVHEEAKKMIPITGSYHNHEQEYAISNLEEFIVGLGSSRELRKALQKKRTLWQRILRTFRRLLGLPSTETEMYEGVLDEFYQVLDSQPGIINDGTTSTEPAFMKKATQNEIDKLLNRVVKSLEKRAERLHRTGQDYKTVLKASEDLAQLESKKGIVEYAANTIKEVRALTKDIAKTLAEPNSVNAAKLRGYKEQLSSYRVMKDIRKHIQQNPADYADMKRENRTILDAIDEILAQILSLETDINEASLDVVAQWVKDNTSQAIPLEEIKTKLRVADRDITLVNRGLDAIINSRDEVLRVIGKTVTNARATAYRETEKYLRDTLYEANENYETWAKSQGIDINDMTKRNAPIIDQDSYNEKSAGIRFIAPDSNEGRRILALSPDHPLRKYYEAVVMRYLASQATIPQHMRPGLRVPSIRRSSLEALGDEKGLGKFRVLKEAAVDTFKRTYDETDRQATDEAGNPLDFIPIRFISKQDGVDGRMDKRDVSLDVASTVTMFIDEMNVHDNLLDVVHDLELAKDVLASREVTVTRRTAGFKGLLSAQREAIVDEDGYVRTSPGITSNSYKQAEQFLKRFVYGQVKNNEGSITIGKTNIDTAKAIDSLLRYTGIRMMAGNLNVAFSNVATGEVTMLKEAIGGRWFTKKDWAYGKKKFATEVVPFMGEFGKRKYDSKFGVIFELFNPEDQGRGNLYLGKDTNRLRKSLTWKNLNLANNIGNLEMNGTLMLSMMNRERLTAPDGTEVGLYDALEVVKGQVTVKKGYKYKGREFTDADINDVRNKIIAVGQKVNGIYNTIDSPGIRAASWGRLVLIMRNWLKPGVDARWRLKYYDERLGKEDEGYYISALNFFRNTFGPDGWMQSNVANLRYIFGVGLDNYNFLTAEELEKISPEEQAELTALRRANLKKFLFEMYVIAVLTALSMFGWDDDEKDSFILYHIVRLKRELSTFFSPTEAWSVLRSPTVALDTIERFSQSIYSLTAGIASGEAFEEYKQGPNRGEVRLWAQLENNIPIWSQRNQFVELDRKIDLIERGWK